jgi:TPR repeat protein
MSSVMWQLNGSSIAYLLAVFCSVVSTNTFAEEVGMKGPAGNRLGNYYRSIGDYEKALSAYRQAAEAGEGWGMIGLADMLTKGEGTAADPQQAIKLLEQAFAAGLKGPAGNRLGNYYRSIGDYEKALSAYRQAAEAGEAWAMIGWAEMLTKGEGTAADPQQAIKLLEQAFAAGLKGPASNKLGNYYRRIGDHEKALSAYRQAAGAGETSAMINLADMFIKGEGTRADRNWAKALLESALKHKNFYAYVGLVALASDQHKSEDAIRSTRALLKDAYFADAAIALDAFNWMPSSSKIAIVQSILGGAALYSGPTDGILTARTLRAIRRFCIQSSIPECKSVAMPKPLLLALLSTLSNDNVQEYFKVSAAGHTSATLRKKSKKPVEAFPGAKQQSASVSQPSTSKKKRKKPVETTGSAKQQTPTVAKQTPEPRKKSRKAVESTGISDQQAKSAAKPSAVSMKTAPVGKSLAPKEEYKETSKSSTSLGKCYIVAGACRSLSRSNSKKSFQEY